MNNDLISREDLLNAIHKVIEESFGSYDIYDKGYNNGLYKASELIDSALAVETHISPEVLNQFAKYVAEHERPQGEWNEIQAGMFCCPFCGARPHKDFKNFCAKCGADMRKKEGDNK